MNSKPIIVQDEWNDDDDQELHDYLKQNYSDYKIMTKEEILELNPINFSCIFCDTKLTKKLLEKTSKYVEIETYPDSLKSFLKREIKIIKVNDLLDKQNKIEYNYFIKPIKNEKDFNGSLITSDLERELVLEEIKDLDEKIYFCKEEKFTNEYRLFILDGKLFGMVDCSEFLIDEKLEKPIEPPKEFIEELLKANEYKNCIIDISRRVDGEWCLIEVNPPYALMSYGFPIESYVEFCLKSWNGFV